MNFEWREGGLVLVLFAQAHGIKNGPHGHFLGVRQHVMAAIRASAAAHNIKGPGSIIVSIRAGSGRVEWPISECAVHAGGDCQLWLPLSYAPSAERADAPDTLGDPNPPLPDGDGDPSATPALARPEPASHSVASMLDDSDAFWLAELEPQVRDYLAGRLAELKGQMPIPEGWCFMSADFSLQAAGKSGFGGVMLVRDLAGKEAWHALSEEEQEIEPLYIGGEGRTVLEAIVNAAGRVPK